MRLKLITLFSCITLSCIASADYKFDYAGIGVASITDSSLAEDIKATGMKIEFSKEIESQFFIGGRVSGTNYDADFINGIYFDAKTTGVSLVIGKYVENENNKLYGYIGVSSQEAEFTIDTTDFENDDTGLIGSFGFIAPISNKLDFLMSIDVDTLYDDTDTSISLGGSFDFNDQASLEIAYDIADEVDAISMMLRFGF